VNVNSPDFRLCVASSAITSYSSSNVMNRAMPKLVLVDPLGQFDHIRLQRLP